MGPASLANSSFQDTGVRQRSISREFRKSVFSLFLALIIPLLRRLGITFCISVSGEPLARVRLRIVRTSVAGPKLASRHVAGISLQKNIPKFLARAWWPLSDVNLSVCGSTCGRVAMVGTGVGTRVGGWWYQGGWYQGSTWVYLGVPGCP